jgi:hypothetical protein
MKSEEELLDALEAYFEVLPRFHFMFHPVMFVLYVTEIEWDGKHLSAAG